MKKIIVTFIGLFLAAMTSTAVFAQSPGLQIQTICNDAAQLPALLTVEDQISPFGPRLEDVELKTLENGRKAVTFAVRNLPVNGAFQFWNLRYAVLWRDACGHLLANTSPSVDGMLLNPNDYLTFQSVATDPLAVRATLRVYFE